VGAWGTGAFDNDAAADFAGELDEADLDTRADLVRHALKRAVDESKYLEEDDGSTAVAAAALVAAQCTDGDPVDPVYGPKQPLPDLPDELLPVAVNALDRVLDDESELVETWAENEDDQLWKEMVLQLRRVLAADV